jgi:acyl carrier protein
MTDIAHQIASFVRERFQVSETDSTFTHDAHLWEEGFIDSMGVVELIVFLQDRFNVEIPPDALFDENYTSITGLARLITKLNGSGPIVEPSQRNESCCRT